MSTLAGATRKSLKASQFGLPSSRKYPMPDKSHARNALARASQQFNAGRLSASQKAQIDAKAHRKLGK
jgi:hypothetical protein